MEEYRHAADFLMSYHKVKAESIAVLQANGVPIIDPLGPSLVEISDDH